MIFAQPQFAFFAAVIFGIHPVNAEVVNCTAFRPNSLAALFCLLAIILYFKFKKTQPRPKYFYLGISLASALLAVFSKEIAVFLPFAIILCEYYQSKTGLGKLLKNNGKVYLLYFGVDLIYALVYFLMLPPTQRILGHTYPIATNFIRMFDILGVYLKDIVFPLDLVSIDALAIFRSWLLVALGAVCFLAAAYTVLKKNKLSPEVSFAVIWFFLWLLPMNNFLNSFRILAAYRYLYLPVIGFAVLLGFILQRIWQAKTKFVVLQRLAPLSLFSYFAIFCISSNATWKNDMILNFSLAEKNPDSVFAHLSLGNTLLKHADIFDAQKEFIFVLSQPDLSKYNPLDISVAYCNLGLIYTLEGQYQKAEQQYQAALKLTPHLAHIYARLGYCYAQLREYEKALDYLTQAKKINPRFSPAYLNAGITYMLMQKYAQARQEFNQALEIMPNYQQVRDNLKKLDKMEKEQKQ
jgi:tetratricopeptide (TPR) repeat protein